MHLARADPTQILARNEVRRFTYFPLGLDAQVYLVVKNAGDAPLAQPLAVAVKAFVTHAG